MIDHDERTTTMQSDVLLIAVAATSLVAGLPSSPYFLLVDILIRAFLQGTILGYDTVRQYLASFLASAICAVVAGVPAAIYERWKGLERSTPVSLGIWLAAVIVITLPAFARVLGMR